MEAIVRISYSKTLKSCRKVPNDGMNKATIVDVVLVIVGAFLALFLVEGIRADLEVIDGCVGLCYMVTMYTAPFWVVGFALFFVVYYRRKNRTLKTHSTNQAQ
jgi:hypothetical protein